MSQEAESLAVVIGTIVAVLFGGLGALVSLIAIGAVFVTVGRERQRIDGLNAAHKENTTEFRNRLNILEQAGGQIGKWQSTVDATLKGIEQTLTELKTIMNERAERDRRRREDYNAEDPPRRRKRAA